MEKYKFLLLIFQSSRLPSKYVFLIFEQWIPCSNSSAWQWWCFPLLCFLCFPHFLTMNSNSPAWQWWCAGQFLCLPNPYAVLENKSVLGNCKFWYYFLRIFLWNLDIRIFWYYIIILWHQNIVGQGHLFRKMRLLDHRGLQTKHWHIRLIVQCVCTHTHWYKLRKISGNGLYLRK